MPERPLAAQELRFLQFVSQRGPTSVGQVAEILGAELGLARTTVQTVLERLRHKRHLMRRRVNGVYLYESAASYEQVMRRTVGQFVDRSLSGSISPFVAYLESGARLDEGEIDELRRVVKSLSTRKGKRS
jgi:predicted transcriptional regulator